MAKLHFQSGNVRVMVSNIGDTVDVSIFEPDESVTVTWEQLQEIVSIIRQRWFKELP